MAKINSDNHKKLGEILHNIFEDEDIKSFKEGLWAPANGSYVYHTIKLAERRVNDYIAKKATDKFFKENYPELYDDGI